MSRIAEFNFVTDELACFSFHSDVQRHFYRWWTADADNPTDFSVIVYVSLLREFAGMTLNVILFRSKPHRDGTRLTQINIVTDTFNPHFAKCDSQIWHFKTRLYNAEYLNLCFTSYFFAHIKYHLKKKKENSERERENLHPFNKKIFNNKCLIKMRILQKEAERERFAYNESDKRIEISRRRIAITEW